MITVKNIAKSYGDVKAVKNMTFEAGDNKITTLLGANGSGKTTTLRAISGLLNIDNGDVHIDGINVAEKTKEAQRRAGCVP